MNQKAKRIRITLRDILRPVIFTDYSNNEHPGMISNWRHGVATVTYDRIGDHGCIVEYGLTTYLADKELNRIRFV